MEILVHRDPDGNGRRVEVTVQSRRPSDRVGGGRGVCMRRAWVTTQEDEDEKCKWDTVSFTLVPRYEGMCTIPASTFGLHRGFGATYQPGLPVSLAPPRPVR